jgi:hypothetical protein
VASASPNGSAESIDPGIELVGIDGIQPVATALALGLEGILIFAGSLIGLRAYESAAQDLHDLVSGHLSPNVVKFTGIALLFFLLAVLCLWAAAVLWQGHVGSAAIHRRSARIPLWGALILNLCAAGITLASAFDRSAEPDAVGVALAGALAFALFAAGTFGAIRRVRAAAPRTARPAVAGDR